MTSWYSGRADPESRVLSLLTGQREEKSGSTPKEGAYDALARWLGACKAPIGAGWGVGHIPFLLGGQVAPGGGGALHWKGGAIQGSGHFRLGQRLCLLSPWRHLEVPRSLALPTPSSLPYFTTTCHLLTSLLRLLSISTLTLPSLNRS